MGISNPGVNIFAGAPPMDPKSTGRVFYVGSVGVPGGVAGSDNAGANGDSPQRPFATLDYAVGYCVAGRGDVIYCLPGHAENIASSTAVTMDISGVTVIGLGRGTLRPTFTFTTATTARINVTAASVSFENCLFVANFADVATCFLITAAPAFRVVDCEFRDTSSVLNFLRCLTTTVTVNADGLEWLRNRVYSLGTTAGTEMILIAGTMARPRINDNFFVGAVLDNTAILLEHGALNVTGLEMGRNIVYRPNTDTATGAALIKTTATANTGIVYNNYVGCLDVAGVLLLTVGSDYAPIENYVTGEVDKSGWLIPAAGTDA